MPTRAVPLAPIRSIFATRSCGSSPLVELDLSEQEPLKGVLAGAALWELAGDSANDVRVNSEWDVSDSTWNPTLILPAGDGLTLTRKVNVSRTGDVVELLTVCPDEANAHDIELAVNGKPAPYQVSMTPEIQRQWLRYRDRSRLRDNDRSHLTDRFAYWWDLSPWRGQEVTLKLTVRGGREPRATRLARTVDPGDYRQSARQRPAPRI